MKTVPFKEIYDETAEIFPLIFLLLIVMQDTVIMEIIFGSYSLQLLKSIQGN